MKVLHLLKTSQGASWAFRQMRELVKRGVDVQVVLPDCSGSALRYSDAGIQVHVMDLDISLNQAAGLPFQIKRFKELVQRIRPDLVHSHFFSTTVLMRLAMRRSPIPRMFQVPGPLHLEHFFFSGSWRCHCPARTIIGSLPVNGRKNNTGPWYRIKKRCFYPIMGRMWTNL